MREMSGHYVWHVTRLLLAFYTRALGERCVPKFLATGNAVYSLDVAIPPSAVQGLKECKGMAAERAIKWEFQICVREEKPVTPPLLKNLNGVIAERWTPDAFRFSLDCRNHIARDLPEQI